MESFVGVLAVAGGFGLALGLTALGMNLVLGIMPSKARRADKSDNAAGAPSSER